MEQKPEGANDSCVGPSAENAGKASSCAGCPNQQRCASGELKKRNPAQDAIDSTMSRVRRILLVLSGKGGVGKSTFSAQLAFGLARKGRRVGLMDVDICGPSVPLMLGLKGHEVKQSASGWQPVYVDVEAEDGVAIDDCELGVMSIGFLVPDPDGAVIWRGPKKNGLIQQFFTSVDWGELDYLIVDTPPGTSDEHISIVQLLKESFKPGDGAVVVTTPQEVAMMDVRKELNFCKQTKVNVIGVVENMAAAHVDLKSLKFTSEETGDDTTAQVLKTLQEKCPEVFDSAVQLEMFPAANGGPKAMAKSFQVPYLGSLPMDADLQKAGELGQALSSGKSLGKLNGIIQQIFEQEKELTVARSGEEGKANGNNGTIIAEEL